LFLLIYSGVFLLILTPLAILSVYYGFQFIFADLSDPGTAFGLAIIIGGTGGAIPAVFFAICAIWLAAATYLGGYYRRYKKLCRKGVVE